MALRWKKDPSETGLRAVGARPRGSKLHDGEKEYAWVCPLGGGWRGPVVGWYWVIPSGVFGDEVLNTSHDPAPDEATAKKQAMDWVRAHLTDSVELRGGPAVSSPERPA